jgi:Trypsin
MRKKLVMLVLIVLALVIATPASAVKFGQPDNGAHPYVGLIVFYDGGGVPQWRCTGTMVSARVMLTAAHCTELNGPARVWFDEDVSQVAEYPNGGGDSYTGTAHASPWWQGGLFLPDTGDVGVVVLDVAPNKGTAPMAGAGYLDSLATARGQQNVRFEVVGYGLQSVKPERVGVRVRLRAEVQLVNLTSQLTDGYNLHTTNNPGQGTGGGGTCFGDSGGAIFHEGNIVAVNSFVLNANCAGASFGYRTDRQPVIDWVNGYIVANP